MTFYDGEEDIERAEIYRLFAGIFMKEPSEELMLQLKEMFLMKFEDSPEEIRMDFVNIFLSPDNRLIPCESLYNYSLGDRPRLWGRAAAEVQEFYGAAGLVMGEEMSLMPDHISMEMLFMSYLIENGLSELQWKFLDEHLVKWIPEYCDEVRRHAGTVFYKEVANVLKEFILSEHELMSE